MTRICFFLMLCLPMLSTAQPADSARLLTLQEYFGWVTEYHPVASRARLLGIQAEAAERMARGGFDPKLVSDWQQKSFDGKEYFTLGESGMKVPSWFGLEFKAMFQVTDGVFLNPENNLPDAGQAILGVKASLGQGLFIDERRAALRKAELLGKLNEAEQQQAVNDLLQDAAKAYWNWTVAYNQLRVFQQALDITQKRYGGIVESFRVGDLPAVDTLETLIQLQSRQFDLNEAQVQYRNATLYLSNFLWYEGRVPLEVTDELRPAGEAEFNTQVILPPVRQFQELLALRHPELRQYQVKLEQLDVDRRLAAEMLKPRLDVEYNFLADGFNFSGGEIENDNGISQLLAQNYKWGIHFSFPILLRKERGKLQLNKIKIMDTDFKLQQKRLELTNKVQQYYNDVVNTRQQVGLYENMVDNYQRLLDAELRKFEIGESSIFLINSREQKLIDAQLKLAKLRGNFWKYYAGLRWAAGVLGE